MIIKSASGDDEQRIAEMEDGLCQKYRLSRKLLYQALRHGDFHQTYRDPGQYWTPACYAAFSGEILSHKLDHAKLQALLGDFARAQELKRAAWDATQFDEMLAGRNDRLYRNHVAVAFRYACAVADDYIWPDPELAGKLTSAQLVELNNYLDFVSKECRIPAGKHARLACQRQIDDLANSHASA